MGANGCKKGKAFERDLAQKIRHIFPNARRFLENHKDDGGKGIDLINTEHYRFQCKSYKAGYVSVNTIFEIEHDSFLGEVPVLVTKTNGKPTMAVLPLDDLIRLLEESSQWRKTLEMLEK